MLETFNQEAQKYHTEEVKLRRDLSWSSLFAFISLLVAFTITVTFLSLALKNYDYYLSGLNYWYNFFVYIATSSIISLITLILACYFWIKFDRKGVSKYNIIASCLMAFIFYLCIFIMPIYKGLEYKYDNNIMKQTKDLAATAAAFCMIVVIVYLSITVESFLISKKLIKLPEVTAEIYYMTFLFHNDRTMFKDYFESEKINLDPRVKKEIMDIVSNESKAKGIKIIFR